MREIKSEVSYIGASFKIKIRKRLKHKTNFGFTLIELLIVIAIIGLLSSVVLASLNSARKKARNVRRMADLRQIVTALEMYYDSNNGYPSSNGAWRSACASYGGYPTDGANGYIPNLAPTYISKLPIDPSPCSSGDGYLYLSDTANYKLLSHVSPESYPSAGQPPRASNLGMDVV